MEKGYNVNKVFLASCIGLAFFGVTMLSLGAIMPPLIELIPEAAKLPKFMSIGIILGTVVFGPVVDRFGYKWLLISGSLLLLLGLVGLTFSNVLILLQVSMIIIGFGGGILNGLTNAMVADIYEDDKRGAKMSLLGACYCIGALLWTLSCSLISDYRIPLTGAIIIIVLSIIYYISIDFPKAKAQNDSVGFKKSLSLLSYPALLLCSFVLFFQSGFEGISGSFLPLFFVKNGIEQSFATFALTMFTIGMLVGRLPMGKLFSILKDTYVLALYLIIALCGSVLIMLYPSTLALIYLGTALLGFGLGATYPVILNHLGGAFSSLSGTAFSIAMFIGLCGQFVFNSKVGNLFENGGESIFPIILIGITIIMVIVSPMAVSMTKKTKLK